MGVTGLWRLIEPAGKPVPVETLENKVLAVDISIWLHQMVKGYQDAKGAPLPNAHLIGLFQRLCKLLYFRIKPVFVFDGGFPQLKKETIAKRQSNKIKYNSESERIKRELAILLSKKTAISGLLGKQISPKKNPKRSEQDDDDIFKLPALPQQPDNDSESEEDDEDTSSGSIIDLHSVNIESESFKNMPVKEKYDLLVELKDTRKMNSWGKLHELPKKSDNFSEFQMQRLLKRRKVQECLEETEKEMGDTGMSLLELESFLNEEGIDTKIETLPTRRIASNTTTRFLLINDVRQALAEAKNKKEEAEPQASTSNSHNEPTDSTRTNAKKDELKEDLDKAIKMSLECVNDADTSATTSKTDESWTTYNTDTDYKTDSDEEDDFVPPDMSSAKAYIMQYSDFTDKVINKMVTKNTKNNTAKPKKPKINEILEEINKEKSVILDHVELSSSDEECIQDISDPENKIDRVQIHEISEINTNKQISQDADENVLDTTQASLVCIGNPVDDVVTLDSSTEESPKKSNNCDSIREFSPKHENNLKALSDSSDDDFEEVLDYEANNKKTVVELTLNVNNAEPEDDIFADIFDEKHDINKISHAEVPETAPNIKSGKLVLDDDDDELQKAIKMSLECMSTEDYNDDNDISEVQTINEIINREEALNEKKEQTKSRPELNKEPPAKKPITEMPNISKTQDSLNTIQSAQDSRTTRNDVPKEVVVPQAKDPPREPLSKEQLNEMVEEIQNEEEDLVAEKGRLDRVGRNITEQMTKEAQELLRIFGIPYIVAPTEAEAQCAFLESVKLTDGTITDDSDIWLFGGQTVYKNFFNQKKHVLQFLADRIEKSFNLSREQLVLLALLVGSDYTTGVDGVGPVTALEILASFPFNKRKLLNETSKHSRYDVMITGLQEFKQWVRSGRRTDNTSLKKKLRNVAVTDDFPSVRVVQAYLEPNIEKSEDKFTWGEIDTTILRDYTKKKFGWSQHKLDEIIKPVLKRLVERKNQKTVHDYFKRNIAFQSLEDQMSKRVKAAVQKMGPDVPIEETIAAADIETLKPVKGKGKKRKTVTAEAGPSKQKKTDNDVLKNQGVRVVTEDKSDGQNKSSIEIRIPKSDRYQEMIPQREKDKQSLLQNKMKAIELFRTTQMDKKKKKTKRKPLAPKAEAELSESSDSS